MDLDALVWHHREQRRNFFPVPQQWNHCLKCFVWDSCSEKDTKDSKESRREEQRWLEAWKRWEAPQNEMNWKSSLSLGWRYFMGRKFLTVEGSLTQQKTCSSLMRRLEMRCRLSLGRAIIRRHLDCPDLATPKPGWGCLGQKLESRRRNWGRQFLGSLMGSQTMGLYCSHQALKIHESEKKSRPAQY